MTSDYTPPKSVAVVGAGMVGLATAWFLREHGAEVTVLDRTGVAAGSSWGNAGWVTPGLSIPLPEPAVLRYGARAVLSVNSPVYVPPTMNPRLLSFLAEFARNSTIRRWQRAMAALVPINRLALGAYDRLQEAGLDVASSPAEPFVAAYRTEASRQSLVDELRHINAAGQTIEFDLVDGDGARELEPALSTQIGAAVVLHGQRFLDPGAYVQALAADVQRRGVKVESGVSVDRVVDDGAGVRLDQRPFDAVVLATGAWLGHLGRQFGVRTIVQAGRGYSFTVPVEQLPRGPVYFPAQRVACTPLGTRLRVAGLMEFRRPDEPIDRRRIDAIVRASSPLLRGVDFEDRRDEWVGARPCTPDGLPLIGRTRSPKVFIAGGHGMWGITLGPITGQLLAEQVMTGRTPAELRPLSPLR